MKGDKFINMSTELFLPQSHQGTKKNKETLRAP